MPLPRSVGARVALVERDLHCGLALNYSSVPPHALIRTSRLYVEMRNAEAYQARKPSSVEVDFPLVMKL